MKNFGIYDTKEYTKKYYFVIKTLKSIPNKGDMFE